MANFNKKLIILGLLIIISLGAVAADDSNATAEAVYEDILSVDGDVNPIILENDSSISDTAVGQWSALKTKINNAAAGDTIYLNGDDYLASNVYSYITIDKDLTIVGGTAENPNQYATLDAGGLCRIFWIKSGINLVVSNVIFKNGYSTSYGGAIYGPNTINLVLNNCKFISNRGAYGGAISMGALIDLTARNCVFENNYATSFGGAIYCPGNSFYCTLINSNFTRNDVAGSGGVAYGNPLNLNATGCIFEDNTADMGGVFYSASKFNGNVTDCVFKENGNVFYLGYDNSLNIVGSRFISNSPIEQALIYATYNSNVRISKSEFSNNKVDSENLISIWGGNLAIDNSNFTNNQLDKGNGLIYAYYYDGSRATVKSSIAIDKSNFVNNTIDGYGGVICGDNLVSLAISNSKFINSTSELGAGAAVYVDYCPNAKIENSLFLNNYARLGGAICTLENTLSILDSNFTSNSAFEGGAIYHMYGSLSVSGEFTGNVAFNGGAIYSDVADYFKLENSKFTSNYADCGGAVLFNAYSITPSIENVLYIDNHATVGENVYYQPIRDYTIGSNNYTLIKGDFSDIDVLPLRYDLRDEGYTTPVGYQGSAGVCWAFSAIAVLESCILKATGQTVDLSESNVKNLAEKMSDYGFLYTPNSGNYHVSAIAYLASWLGPVLEELDRFSDQSIISAPLSSIYHVQNVLYLKKPSNFIDNEHIKHAIYQYGAVGTSYYNNLNSYYNDDTYGYYCNVPTAINHAITIVGWDDTYSRNNFKIQAPGDGAWIIKNSWGESFGDEGYFYISYYDQSLFDNNNYNPAYTIILNESQRFNRNYQYDIAGPNYFFSPGVLSYKISNTFTADTNDFLAAASTYFSNDVDYTLNVYVNNELKSSASGHSIYGYQTVYLNDLVPIKVGDKFTVEFAISSSSAVSIPICAYIQDRASTASRITYTSGVSYLQNGYSTYDLYTRINKGVACIKAFTTSLATNIQLDKNIDYHDVKLVATVKDENGNAVNGAVVNFTVNGVSYLVDVVDGKATCLNATDNLKRYNITATLMDNGYYYSSTTNLTLSNLKSTNLTVWAEHVNSTGNLTIDISFFDSENIGVNAVVRVKFHDKQYDVNVVNGTGYLNVYNDLNPGDYRIDVIFNGNEYYDGKTASAVFSKGKFDSELNITSIEINHFDAVITFTTNFDDDVLAYIDGKPVSNTNNKITLSNLTLGPHNVSLIFNGNDNFKEAYATSNFTISKVIPTITVTNTLNKNSATIRIVTNVDTKLNVYVNDKFNRTVAISKGKASFKLNDLAVGDYVITVKCEDDPYYYDGEANTSFAVEKLKKTVLISASDITMYCKDGTRFYVALMDEDSNYIDGLDFIINIDGVEYERTSNATRMSSVALNLNPGVYNALVSYNGSSIYEEASRNFTITIKSSVLSSDVVKIVKNDTYFAATFLDSNGKPWAGSKITYNINGVMYYRTTNSSGMARLNLNLVVGDYTLTAITENGEMASFDIKILPNMVGENIKKYYKNGTQYKITLLDNHGNAAPGAVVEFNINGVFYTRTAREGGVATMNINLVPGVYILTAIYNDALMSNTIEVLSTIESSNIDMTVDNRKKFVVKVLDDKGKPVVGSKLSFNVHGVIYDRISDANGEAGLNINLMAGKYIITTYYGELAQSNVITIKP